MWLPILAIWGCLPELTKDCVDMTNSSSTYLGIVVGAAVGAIIAWWIYNRQKMTSRKQDYILQRIENIEEKNRRILTDLETFANHHDKILNEIFLLNQSILALEKKIEKHSQQ
jgi:type II secretory pathway component PulF